MFEVLFYHPLDVTFDRNEKHVCQFSAVDVRSDFIIGYVQYVLLIFWQNLSKGRSSWERPRSMKIFKLIQNAVALLSPLVFKDRYVN